MSRPVFLFDVDGVLVDPRAYKVGIVRTLEFLLSQTTDRNISELLPDDAEFAYMESRGIHDVWDMCNIMFALFIDQAHSHLNSIANFSGSDVLENLNLIRSFSFGFKRPDYKDFAGRITEHPGHPPDFALQILSKDKQDAEAWISLLNSFLKGTRSVYDSFGTKLFQNIILGSEIFESTYELESICKAKSLIKSEDTVLLNASMSNKILELNKRHLIRAGIYTARPSLPPPDINSRRGYSPEAEMAAEASGLSSLPLVGMGMMEWLAGKHHERTEDLTKPNTTHSLSALLATLKADSQSEIIEIAYDYDKKKSPASISELRALLKESHKIFVFEDTSSGIKPMRSLSEHLNDQGYRISIAALGIANHASKRLALEPLCERVFENINQALEYALSQISI